MKKGTPNQNLKLIMIFFISLGLSFVLFYLKIDGIKEGLFYLTFIVFIFSIFLKQQYKILILIKNTLIFASIVFLDIYTLSIVIIVLKLSPIFIDKLLNKNKCTIDSINRNKEILLKVALFGILKYIVATNNLSIYSNLYLTVLLFLIVDYLLLFYKEHFKKNDYFQLTQAVIESINMFIFTNITVLLLINFNIIYLNLFIIYIINFSILSTKESIAENHGEHLYLDDLTEVYNKSYLYKTMNSLISKKENFCFLMIDLNKFKEINDKYGHITGDNALKYFVKILNKFISKKYIYRFGGDEFSILIEEKEYCQNFIEEIESYLKKNPFIVRNSKEKLYLTASFGYYYKQEDDITVEKIIDKADKKMYSNKK